MKKRILLFVTLLVCLFPFSGSFAQNAENAWKIAILRTEAPYAVEMEEGFKKHLKSIGYVENEGLIFLPTIVVGSNTDDFPRTAQITDEIINTEKPDIIVGIGTQASIPVWPIVQKTDIPMVFAGVTYPIEGGLIEAFGKPTGKNITGISYGVPPVARLELFRKMFPDADKFKKIAFVYNGKVPQEIIYSENLKALPRTAGWEILYIDFFDYDKNVVSHDLLLEKLKQLEPDVIFGWFSLDQLSANLETFKELENTFGKPILGITSIFTDAGAIGGVLTDHFALGTMQAKIVDRIIKGEKAGDIVPMQPVEYLIELNLKKAHELGIEFDLDLIGAADRIVK